MSKGPAGAFEVLRDLSRLTAADLPLDELLAQLLTHACTLVGADGALVVLKQPPLRVLARLSRPEAEKLAARPGTPERVQSGGESILVAPILSGGEPVGHMAALARRRAAFSPEHEEVLAFLARSLVGDLESARLYRVATIDPVTRAGNRQLLAERLPDEIRRSRRSGRPLALVRFGVRKWQRLVDVQGHARAHAALAEIVRRVRSALRSIDYVVRLGEDVFVCVLPSAGAGGAEKACARIAERVARAPIALPGGPEVNLTLALGAAVLEEGMDEAALLAAAERSMRR